MMTSTTRESYYDILGVSTRATNKQIITAYRKLALKFHPDPVAGGDAAKAAATNKFTKISEAYRNLNDERSRWEYDNIHGIGSTTNAEHRHELLAKVEKFFAQHRVTPPMMVRPHHKNIIQQQPGVRRSISFSIRLSSTTLEPNGVRKTVSKSSRLFNGKRGTITETTYLYSGGRKEVIIEDNSSLSTPGSCISTKHLHGSNKFCNYLFTGVQERVAKCIGATEPFLCGSIPCVVAAK